MTLFFISMTSSVFCEASKKEDTDFLRVDIASAVEKDGTKKPPFLIIIEQRSSISEPRTALGNEMIEILKANMLITTQSNIVVGDTNIKNILVIYEYLPSSKKILLNKASFSFLPKKYYPFTGLEIPEKE